MTVLAFDTHKAVKELRVAGATEPLAEAVVATVGAAMGENVATKADIAAVQSELAEVKTEVKAEVKANMNEIRGDLKADRAANQANLAGLEARLYRHLWIMAASIVGLTVTLIKVFE